MDWKRLLTGLLLALPFLAYAATVWHFAVDVPFWDDYSVILMPLNAALAADSPAGALAALLQPNAGHLPFLTRAVSLLQVATGGINFRQSVLAANAGWLLATALLLWHGRRSLQLPWPALLPIPYLLLAITHWEALDFTTPAWQMYWGSGLLPLLSLLALTARRGVLAALAFGAALFCSAGSLALYPLGLGYCLWRRAGRTGVAFGLLGGLFLAAFLACNPPQAHSLPDVASVLRYIPAFMGNVVATGSWYLVDYAWLHWPLGLLVIAAGVACVLRETAPDSSKLVFLYVLALAGMAIYLRGDVYAYVVSRYSLFALLALAALYLAFLQQAWARGEPRRQALSAIATVLAAGLWLHSYSTCLGILAANRNDRLQAAQRYADQQVLGTMIWDNALGREILDTARARGVYDTRHWDHY